MYLTASFEPASYDFAATTRVATRIAAERCYVYEKKRVIT